MLGEVKANSTKCDYRLSAFKEENAIPELKRSRLNDPRPMIRGTAYWAIGQIQGEDARHFINENFEKEIEEVQVEMKKAWK